MVFNSLTFVIFFAIVCALMALTNTGRVKALLGGQIRNVRQITLLIASYVFYGWWNWKCCFLMLGLTCAAHFCAAGYKKSRKKYFVTAGVVAPLIVLGIFKYFNFFVDSFCAAFGIARAGALQILLPVGISFYTFQSLSYTIDVYRGKIEAERSFVKTALYVSFFPQLVAGPIVKAGDFIPQLYEDRNISLPNLEAGVQYFMFGLFKKIVIADNISVFVDAVFENPAQFHAVSVMLAAAAYSIQIYCDFSGYSDMAVGCAKCLGYDLMRNFNLPFLSKNVTEFWKRWHISLSSWLQEYLYIPLGGNRKGRIRTYINLMLTMLIGGLWHGADWSFIVWGGLHGAALCVHKVYMRRTKDRTPTKLGTALSIAGTFLFVSLCFVFFRANNCATAIRVLQAMATGQNGVVYLSAWALFGLAAVAAGEIAAVVRSEKNGERWNGYYPTVKLNTVPGLTVFFLFVGLTLGLGYTGENPFIYFQF